MRMGLRGSKQLCAVARRDATFRQMQAIVCLWDVDARRWAAWLDTTSIDTCSSLFMPSRSLFFGSVESDCRGERGNVRDREMGEKWGVTKITETGDLGRGMTKSDRGLIKNIFIEPIKKDEASTAMLITL